MYLGNTRDPSALEPLADLLQDEHADGELRLLAARGLGQLRDPRARVPLEAQLSKPDIWIMTEARTRHINQVRGLRREAEGDLAEELGQLLREAEKGAPLHHEVREALHEIG